MYPLKIKEKYDQWNLPSLSHRFTVVYLWTYKDWDYTENVWSHTWVDIVPVCKNQEVLAVLDGKIFSCWEDWAYGKFIFIEHTNVADPDDFSRKTTLYSCYEHLSEIKVNIWDIVHEWDIIGKTGNTGNSFWEHLHFQMDRMQAPFHAYWPFTWAEAKAAWQSFTGWVNIWLWLDKAKMYTVNPLVYLDKLLWSIPSHTPTMNIQKPQEEKKEVIKNSPPTVLKTEDKKEVVKNSPPTVIKTEEKIAMISSWDNLIGDSTNDILSSLNDDLKKKNLMI